MVDMRIEALELLLLPASEVTWLDVAREAARIEGVNVLDVLSPRRPASVVRARHRAWFRLREAGYSFPEIARGWGVDHTTVIAGCAAHRARHPVRIAA